nr:hypothetical protein CFP56_32505 [Quercus suber]
MALHRGIQSAIFYYLSCAPCADARYRKKRKEEAAQDRAEWEQLEAQMPNLYRHPSPSSTNPYWQAEIAMGPSLSRGKRKTHAQGSERGLKMSATQSSNGSNLPSSVDLPHDGRSWDDRLESGWKLKQYQREDEQLWGSASSAPPSRSRLSSQSNVLREPTRPLKAKTKAPPSSSSSSTYKEYRNPAVNELHPAIATRVATRAEVAWMLQPPPVAEVMNGKERVARSRSNSGASRPSTTGSVPSMRRPSTRIAENKLQLSGSNLSRRSSSPSGPSDRPIPVPIGQVSDVPTILTNTETSDFAGIIRRTEPTQMPRISSSEGSTDSETTTMRRVSLAPESMKQEQSRKLTSRPQLSTIVSESIHPSVDQGGPTTLLEVPKENSPPNARRTYSDQGNDREKSNRRPELPISDSSLKGLPLRNKPAFVLNTQIFATGPSPGETMLQVSKLDGGENDESGGERRNTGEAAEAWRHVASGLPPSRHFLGVVEMAFGRHSAFKLGASELGSLRSRLHANRRGGFIMTGVMSILAASFFCASNSACHISVLSTAPSLEVVA